MHDAVVMNMEECAKTNGDYIEVLTTQEDSALTTVEGAKAINSYLMLAV